MKAQGMDLSPEVTHFKGKTPNLRMFFCNEFQREKSPTSAVQNGESVSFSIINTLTGSNKLQEHENKVYLLSFHCLWDFRKQEVLKREGASLFSGNILHPLISRR